MNSRHLISLAAGWLATALAAAQPPCPVTPFDISLIPGHQLYPPHYNVAGLRLNTWEIRHAEVFGVDLGLQQHSTRFSGLQIAVFHTDTQDAGGIQFAGWTADTLAFNGLQIAGAVAEAEKVNGFQLTAGLAYAENVNGLQFALGAAESRRTGLNEKPPARVHGIQMAGIHALANTVSGLQAALLHAENDRTGGFQISPGYAETRQLSGLQIGGAALSGPVSGGQISPLLARARGPLRGVQIGLLAEAETIQSGWQLAGLTARSRGAADGALQTALFNAQAERLSGVQLVVGIAQTGSEINGLQAGLLYNDAPAVNGMQFGLINRCNTLNGLQLGLINLRTETDGKPRFLPLFRFQRSGPDE